MDQRIKDAIDQCRTAEREFVAARVRLNESRSKLVELNEDIHNEDLRYEKKKLRYSAAGELPKIYTDDI